MEDIAGAPEQLSGEVAGPGTEAVGLTPYERIYEEAMARIAFLAKHWNDPPADADAMTSAAVRDGASDVISGADPVMSVSATPRPQRDGTSAAA